MFTEWYITGFPAVESHSAPEAFDVVGLSDRIEAGGCEFGT